MASQSPLFSHRLRWLYMSIRQMPCVVIYITFVMLMTCDDIPLLHVSPYGLLLSLLSLHVCLVYSCTSRSLVLYDVICPCVQVHVWLVSLVIGVSLGLECVLGPCVISQHEGWFLWFHMVGWLVLLAIGMFSWILCTWMWIILLDGIQMYLVADLCNDNDEMHVCSILYVVDGIM